MSASTIEVTTPGDTEVRLVRWFDASRDLVFRAYTEPEILKRWLLGPPGWTMEVCEVDLRVGGDYRYKWRNESGELMGLMGKFREVDPPARLVSAETFDEDWTGGETTVTVTFEERDGRTALTTLIRYSSPEARSAALQTGMTEGMSFGFNLLAEVLATLD